MMSKKVREIVGVVIGTGSICLGGVYVCDMCNGILAAIR